jgi:hypothetical protein
MARKPTQALSCSQRTIKQRPNPVDEGDAIG